MTLFLDCDGVFADFDARAEQLFGMNPRVFEEEYGTDEFWEVIRNDSFFFLELELIPESLQLWARVQHLNPIFLTGAPMTMPDSFWQKPIWIHRKFGVDARVIVCQSKDKSKFCKPYDVIVDDYPKHRQKWIDAGGVWIDHDRNDVYRSIKKLEEIGII